MVQTSKDGDYEEHPLTEYLDFTFSKFGRPSIHSDDGKIVLPVLDFKIYAGFPSYDELVLVAEGEIIFEKVNNLVREVREIDQGSSAKAKKTLYKEAYRIDDGLFPEISDKPYSFYIGGFSFDPIGWIEWELDIVNVDVRVLKQNS